jgi:ATP-dependent Zn protease
MPIFNQYIGFLLNKSKISFYHTSNNASDKGVYILAASNHHERIDKAVLRTGRIDEMVYIDMPDILHQNVCKTRLLYKKFCNFVIGSHIKYFCNPDQNRPI